jgi:predicted DNA-binding transcriptional regulator YafY
MFKGTAMYDSLESVFKKVKANLPAQTIEYLKKMESSFKVGLRPYKPYGRWREMINQIDRAVLDRVRLDMAYLPLRTDKETVRQVDPLKVYYLDGSIYLIGFCHLRGQVRMFVLDRIKMLRLTDERFEPPEDFDLDEFMASSFKVMHDDLYRVKVRISRQWSRWVGEKIWHESQKMEKLPDGGLEITFKVAGLDEIRMWVLSLAPQARVVEPKELRQAVFESLTASLEHYPEFDLADSRRARESSKR